MSYKKQDRGSAEAYANYYAGMDKSMHQKIALITSFFPTQGVIADMGSGSGKGSYDLAQLYPELSVIGIDINQAAVDHSNNAYKLPNLKFSQGDIAEAKFPDLTFDGILNSSVLHHVTTFTGYSNDKLEELLDNQTRQLKEGGILAVRDFIAPAGQEIVYLEIPTDDGKSSGAISELSTAALFEIFTKNFRCNSYKKGGIPLVPSDGAKAGWQRYKTSLRIATEFVLRKDYRKDWETEIQEEYTYYTKKEFESALAARGLRLVISRNLYNSWIIENRFKGKFIILDENLNDLGFPPTNYLIVGEKTSEAVRLIEVSRIELSAAKYLQISSFKDPKGAIWDLVERKYPVIDILPWFRHDNGIYVLFRQSYPRPISNSNLRTAGFDDCTVSGFINEPLTGIIKEDLSTKENIEQILSVRAGIKKDQIKNIEDGLVFMPSPGGINEIVNSAFVEIEHPNHLEFNSLYETGFVSRERIRATESGQLLRSYQVGGMFDARLEMHVYELLHRQNKLQTPWVGGELLSPAQQDCLELKDFSGLIQNKATEDHFVKVDNQKSKFISVYEGQFSEIDSNGQVLSSKTFEYITPSTMSTLSIAIICYCLVKGELAVALEERDLPAIQLATGNSRIQAIPAWRIPKNITDELSAMKWLREKASIEFGLEIKAMQQLGGTYLPSSGITPESVLVVAAPITKITSSLLNFVSLSSLFEARSKLIDGHSLISLMRFAHASEN